MELPETDLPSVFLQPLFSIALLGAQAGTELTLADQDSEPVRALFVVGGEYHATEACSNILTMSLQREMKIEMERIRIDVPPEGLPRLEKIKLPCKPEVLEDPQLDEKYDLILAFTQELHTRLTSAQMAGLLGFVRRGGGWVGMHSASDTSREGAEYIAMVGGRFESHPPFGEVTARRVAGDHPVLKGVEDFTLQDEFYHLSDCRLDDKQLLMVGQSPGDGKTRPMAWAKSYGKGRVFYTILGHTPKTYMDEHFRRLMGNAVRWAARER